MPRRSKAWAGRLVLASVGLWLIAVGGERMWDGWSYRAVERYLHAKWWQRDAQADLSAALAARLPERDGRAWSASGQVWLELANRAVDAEARQAALAKAEEATRRALVLAPGQASTWARLALIAVNTGQTEVAVAALRASTELAPNGVGLAWPRAKLGFFLWPKLDAATQTAIARDMQRVARLAPTAAMPYPKAALQRYAASLGAEALVTRLLASEV